MVEKWCMHRIYRKRKKHTVTPILRAEISSPFYMQHRNTIKGVTNTVFLISLIQDFYFPSTQGNQSKIHLGWVLILNKKLWYKDTFNAYCVERQNDDPPPIPKEKQWSIFSGEWQAVGSERKEAYSGFPQKKPNKVLTSWRKAKCIIVPCSLDCLTNQFTTYFYTFILDTILTLLSHCQDWGCSTGDQKPKS